MSSDESTGDYAVGDWVLCSPDGQVRRRLERVSLLERRIANAEALNAAELEVSARENETETLLTDFENTQAVDDALAALKSKVAASA